MLRLEGRKQVWQPETLAGPPAWVRFPAWAEVTTRNPSALDGLLLIHASTPCGDPIAAGRGAVSCGEDDPCVGAGLPNPANHHGRA